MWSDADFKALTDEQRTELAQRLAVTLPAKNPLTPGGLRRRRFVINLLVLCSTALIPWIIFLAVTLPRRYEAGHWRAAWVGFDVFLLIGLATTAWAGWRRRRMVIATSLMTGTLLATDVWFDVLTSSTSTDLWSSLAGALLVELPLALLLLWIAGRLLKVTGQEARQLAGLSELHRPFWQVPLFVLDRSPVVTTDDQNAAEMQTELEG